MPSLLDPAPPPTSKLGRYRQLSARAAIHVSPLCLGGGAVGEKWGQFNMVHMNKVDSFKMLDAYYEAGGNFIDTASIYHDGESEAFIGEWAEARDIRDQLIIATKYANDFHRGNRDIKQHVNYVGNNIKALKLTVEASLKKLRTSYIDILFLHWWDLHTSIEEIMDALHNLVVSGTVLYLGVSNTPAWFISRANEYARQKGKTPFVVCQVAYNVLQRDIERELLPMCRFEGMALMFWNVLASGRLRTDEEEERRRVTGEKGRLAWGESGQHWERTPNEKKMSDALQKVANEVGAKSIAAVAISYTMHKAPYVFPIIGGRKVEHMQSNIEALSVSLSPEQIKYLDGISPFDSGYPTNIMGEYGDYPQLVKYCAEFDPQPLVAPVPHTSN